MPHSMMKLFHFSWRELDIGTCTTSTFPFFSTERPKPKLCKTWQTDSCKYACVCMWWYVIVLNCMMILLDNEFYSFCRTVVWFSHSSFILTQTQKAGWFDGKNGKVTLGVKFENHHCGSGEVCLGLIQREVFSRLFRYTLISMLFRYVFSWSLIRNSSLTE